MQWAQCRQGGGDGDGGVAGGIVARACGVAADGSRACAGEVGGAKVERLPRLSMPSDGLTRRRLFAYCLAVLAVVRFARSADRWPHRLEAQDTALSRRRHGFESHWGHLARIPRHVWGILVFGVRHRGLIAAQRPLAGTGIEE